MPQVFLSGCGFLCFAVLLLCERMTKNLLIFETDFKLCTCIQLPTMNEFPNSIPKGPHNTQMIWDEISKTETGGYSGECATRKRYFCAAHNCESCLQASHLEYTLVPVLKISLQIVCALRGPKRVKCEEIIYSWQLYADTKCEASLKRWQMLCHTLTLNNKTIKQKQTSPAQTTCCC